MTALARWLDRIALHVDGRTWPTTCYLLTRLADGLDRLKARTHQGGGR